MRVSPPFFARILTFGLICVAPIVSWVAFGTVDPYGNPHPSFPGAIQLVKGESSAFDALGSAALRRSPVTPLAISLKNTVFDRVLHRIDTESVISGRYDWLFYKEDFWGASCVPPGEFLRPLAEIDALTEMANAAGLAMVVSVSPDKSTIYPEKLLSTDRRYWNCKRENGRLWRRLAASEAPLIVDHAVPLLSAKTEQPRRGLFFRGDTHWTPYGAALGLRQLLKAMFPEKPIDTARLAVTGMSYRQVDMRNRILLEYGEEPVETIDDGIAEVVQDRAKTLILIDSFYGLFITDRLARVFPNSDIVNYAEGIDGEAIGKAIDAADRLIINSVERLFFWRSRQGGRLSSTGVIGLAILSRNAKAAEACTYADTESDAPLAGATASIDIPRPAADKQVCLQIKLLGWGSGNVRVTLPSRDTSANACRSLRSIFYAPNSSGTLKLVLPDSTKGRSIIIELPPDTNGASFALGERASATR